MSNSQVILKATGLQKFYNDGVGQVNILQDLDFSITAGEQIAIIGPSGSGKSTLLHLLGGLEKPSKGEIHVAHNNINHNIWQCSEKKRCQLRNSVLGFVYQFHHLLPEFTALENTAMPLLIANNPLAEVQERAKTLLERAGLGHRLHHKPGQLSGGERQRVAIVRALVNNPRCILADEPTGNLDQKTAESVYELLLELNRSLQTSLIIVTHDEKLAARMDKIYCLSDGKLVTYP